MQLKNNLAKIGYGLLFSSIFVPSPGITDEFEEVSTADFLELSLEELLSITVTSASGVEESLRDAAASLVVITAQDIEFRAYTHLGQVLQDLPGFDVITSHSHDKTIGYQRGYRTSTNQRTLYMFNGVINNTLWFHEFAVNYQVPLTNVERIEVLYGPAGAIYGPNAFSGVVNIITRDARKLAHGATYFDYNIQAHSYATTAFDFATGGRFEHFSYSLSAKFYDSQGPDLNAFSDGGYTHPDYLSDETIWGPVLHRESQNRPYGEYYSPDQEQGVIGEVNWKNLTLGLNHWQTTNGYGVKFAFDKGQPNGLWSKRVNQLYLRHNTQLSDDLAVTTFVKTRSDRRYGDWAEATADWRDEMQGYSFVSISLWNSESSSWKVRQDWDYQASNQLQLLAGLKYENKTITKAYDVCGYWAASFCSSDMGKDLGPEGLGLGVYHSSYADPLPLAPGPLADMPPSNLINTQDKGAYVQGTYSLDNWVYSAAVRWDQNSEYGDFIKPRVSAIFHFDPSNTFKFIYGTAFQEPPPVLLYGGWNGRRANPDLKPEEMANIELIWLNQQGNWSHDVSVYVTDYDHVIKEEAENAGERQVTGLEYRGRFQLSNPFNDAKPIKGYLNYTFTESRSNITYDHNQARWIGSGIDDCVSGAIERSDPSCREVDAELGDIAPHKINVGVNLPVFDNVNLNLRANYVSERNLYLRNPLRDDKIKADAYTLVNANIGYQFPYFRLDLSIQNLFDAHYQHPGLQSANSGTPQMTDTGAPARYDNGNLIRSAGFQNSLLPQLERNYAVILSGRF